MSLLADCQEECYGTRILRYIIYIRLESGKACKSIKAFYSKIKIIGGLKLWLEKKNNSASYSNDRRKKYYPAITPEIRHWVGRRYPGALKDLLGGIP